jgi:hypothetical protein
LFKGCYCFIELCLGILIAEKKIEILYVCEKSVSIRYYSYSKRHITMPTRRPTRQAAKVARTKIREIYQSCDKNTSSPHKILTKKMTDYYGELNNCDKFDDYVIDEIMKYLNSFLNSDDFYSDLWPYNCYLKTVGLMYKLASLEDIACGIIDEILNVLDEDSVSEIQYQNLYKVVITSLYNLLNS